MTIMNACSALKYTPIGWRVRLRPLALRVARCGSWTGKDSSGTARGQQAQSWRVNGWAKRYQAEKTVGHGAKTAGQNDPQIETAERLADEYDVAPKTTGGCGKCRQFVHFPWVLDKGT